MTFPDKSGMSLSGAQFFTMTNDLGQLALARIQMRMGELELAESSADVDIGIGDIRGDKMLSLKMKHKPGLRGSCERDHFLCQFVLQILDAFHYGSLNTVSCPLYQQVCPCGELWSAHRTARFLTFSIIKTYARCESRQEWRGSDSFQFH
jgi:hypothetical protein